MTGVLEEPTYEFDVAISFAGEDREFVQDIASRLKDAGIRVFYDTDYQAAMWGEDLVDYLDQVYRVKARYAIIFISRFYAEKMWTRHERRSALARALEQRSAYVLPVRLDSTALEGLRPTVGYLDAPLVGPDGIVSATLAKLTGSSPAQPAAITRVPRTEAERQQLLLARPPAWEYLYFAGQLLYERNSVGAKYRDHEIRYASASGEVVGRADIAGFISRRANDAIGLAKKMTMLVGDTVAQERAFGAPGQAGDADRLAHLAKRWNSVYEELLDWAASVRGASPPSEFHNLLELLARYADGPVEQYRLFVDDYVAKVDAVPAAVAAGNKVRLKMSLTISIPVEVRQAYNSEFERLIQHHKFQQPGPGNHTLSPTLKANLDELRQCTDQLTQLMDEYKEHIDAAVPRLHQAATSSAKLRIFNELADEIIPIVKRYWTQATNRQRLMGEVDRQIRARIREIKITPREQWSDGTSKYLAATSRLATSSLNMWNSMQGVRDSADKLKGKSSRMDGALQRLESATIMAGGDRGVFENWLKELDGLGY